MNTGNDRKNRPRIGLKEEVTGCDERRRCLSQTTSSGQASPGQHTAQEKHALIRQALDDEDSYRKLYRGVAIYAFKLLGSCTSEIAHERAEEIVQEAIAQAFAKVDTYDTARPAITWLL